MVNSLVASFGNYSIHSLTELKKIDYICAEHVRHTILSIVQNSIVANLEERIFLNYVPMTDIYSTDISIDFEYTDIDVTFIDFIKEDVYMYIEKILFKYLYSVTSSSSLNLCINTFIMNNNLVITCREVYK